MNHQTILTLSLLGAIIHIAEEYVFGWIRWANEFIPGINLRQFVVINILFIMLCIFAVIINESYTILSSSIFSLLLINALIHIGPTIKYKKYSPGLVSAILIFIPLGVYGYTNLLENNTLSMIGLIVSGVTGLLWMAIPFIFQLARIKYGKVMNG